MVFAADQGEVITSVRVHHLRGLLKTAASVQDHLNVMISVTVTPMKNSTQVPHMGKDRGSPHITARVIRVPLLHMGKTVDTITSRCPLGMLDQITDLNRTMSQPSLKSPP